MQEDVKDVLQKDTERLRGTYEKTP